MVDPECLDPKEVLAHLNSLGYCDISPQKLKEFIHDLTKLIKYEQKRASQHRLEIKSRDTQPNEYDGFSSDFSDGLEKSPNRSYASYESSTYSASTSATTYSAGNNRQSSRNHVESEYIQRYHTSFIRPWNLQGCKDLSARGKKSLDPVRLYHHYREIWKKQRIPGENKHLDLRWDIRNRMVGQEPTPRIKYIVVWCLFHCYFYSVIYKEGCRKYFLSEDCESCFKSNMLKEYQMFFMPESGLKMKV